MSLEIRERDFDSFFETPLAVYGPTSPYVPMMQADMRRYLDPGKNPLLIGGGELTYFTALRNGRPVARLTAHTHPQSDRRHGWKRGCFGWFDAADDLEAAQALLARAEAFVRAQGCDHLAGAFNLTAMQQIGIVTEGFEHAPYTDMVWTPPHLPRLLEACGYERFFPMSTFEFDVAAVEPAALRNPRSAEVLASPDWTFAPIDRRHFAERFEEARACLNDGFRDNPMFVPLTAEEFRFQAGEMMWILDPEIAAIARHRQEPAGVIICIPDLSPFLRATGGRMGLSAPLHLLRTWLRRERAVIILYSVKRAMHGLGLNAAMLERVVSALRRRGYRRCGVTWIADSNAASLRQVEKLGARRLHRLHLFRKALA
ncbi:GNAT family N-acetyltransferase [Phenylobacterium sp.]|uniref:GNAT family N-acetyltransferase n=1 Tax=Phenylobacterium sp. TaxID=1871053 RepID=UPI002810D85D|nr:GNAT family N-acetyltransferase [Phenylobacterium sp.]